MSADRRPASPEEIGEARWIWQNDDDLVIDDNAEVLPVEYGMWVQAWVWVPAPENAVTEYIEGLKKKEERS